MSIRICMLGHLSVPSSGDQAISIHNGLAWSSICSKQLYLSGLLI
jgi:hypothetical protein